MAHAFIERDQSPPRIIDNDDHLSKKLIRTVSSDVKEVLNDIISEGAAQENSSAFSMNEKTVIAKESRVENSMKTSIMRSDTENKSPVIKGVIAPKRNATVSRDAQKQNNELVVTASTSFPKLGYFIAIPPSDRVFSPTNGIAKESINKLPEDSHTDVSNLSLCQPPVEIKACYKDFLTFVKSPIKSREYGFNTYHDSAKNMQKGPVGLYSDLLPNQNTRDCGFDTDRDSTKNLQKGPVGLYSDLLPNQNTRDCVENTSNTDQDDQKVSQYAISKGRKRRRRKKVSTKNTPVPSDILENGAGLHISWVDTLTVEEKAIVIFEAGAVECMQPPNRKDSAGSRGQQYKYQPRDVEADGKVSDVASDPPGQQSVYIPPGDQRREVYRLSTFENFPPCPAEPSILARHGFFYTGFYDRVKCFCCARTVQEWRQADDPRDKKWHHVDCDFAKGLPTDNVPVGTGFASFLSGNVSRGSTSQGNDVAERQAETTVKNVRYPGNMQQSSSGGSYQLGPGSSIHIGGGQSAVATNPSSGRLNPSQHRVPATPREWRMANVISSDHRRMLTNLFLVRELDRLASFCRWSVARPNVSPSALARAGFFYLGDMDRTQCFSCGGVLRNWTIEDDAFDEHRSHFPDCRFIRGLDDRNVPIPEVDETVEERNAQFPCRFPSNPHMRAGRLETFDRRWPRGRVQATPEQIDEAGFFFLGERDRVKCWYCNGGLQNWEYEDVPWIEHAKWFPTCQFLLREKGVRFVYRHLVTSPHFPRPIIARQDGGQVGAQAMDVPPPQGASRVQAPSPPPEIVDPQEEMRKRQENVDRIMENSDNVQTVIAMGYEAETVKQVLEEAAVTSTHEEIFDSMMSLLEEVMKKEEEIKKQREEQETARRAQEMQQRLQQQRQQPASIQPTSFQTISSNYSMASNITSMETTPSVSAASTGMFNVSAFGDSDDEGEDLYGGITEGAAIGAVGGHQQQQTPSTSQPQTSSYNLPQDTESMKEMLDQKQEEKLCKICYTNDADMVFVPCSHMVCCKTCTEAIRQCPVCRKKIEKAIRTYLN